MHATSPGAARHHHTRAQIEVAIVRVETELTLSLERLGQRREAGRDCTIAEEVVRSAQVCLASLHEHRNRVLQAEAEK
jgi:hypothetical protein